MRGVGVLGFFGSCGALYVAAGSALSMMFCIRNERTQTLHKFLPEYVSAVVLIAPCPNAGFHSDRVLK